MNIFLASIHEKRAVLDPDESWHCAKVLRKRPGDEIKVIDGKGNFYSGVLDLVTEKKCEASLITEPSPQESRDYRIHLAIAPTKQMDRMEWMIEKAVEIGVDEISFVFCKNSERNVIKLDRLEKLVLSAVKQSLLARIPILNEGKTIGDFLKTVVADQKLIAWLGEGGKADIRKIRFAGWSTVVLIGPEGDFTTEEVKLAHEKGFQDLDLGANRLRTETAGLFVVQAAALL